MAWLGLGGTWRSLARLGLARLGSAFVVLCCLVFISSPCLVLCRLVSSRRFFFFFFIVFFVLLLSSVQFWASFSELEKLFPALANLDPDRFDTRYALMLLCCFACTRLRNVLRCFAIGTVACLARTRCVRAVYSTAVEVYCSKATTEW